MSEETWKDIMGYEGIYQVSNIGKIRGLDRIIKHPSGVLKKWGCRILKKKTIWSGYESVCLCKNNIKKHYSVHRLVLKTFYPIADEANFQVNHINGIRSDNRLDNLEWCTASDNNKHSFRVLKRKPTKYWAGKIGGLHPNSIPVIQKDITGNIIDRFDSSATAARVLGLSEDTISRASRKKRKTAYGFIWERGLA